MSLNNLRLSKLLGVSAPIISAPMAGASGGSLAAQVTLGGGFGFVAAGYDTIESFQKEFTVARQLLGTAEGSPLKIGSSFLCWLLDKDETRAQQLLNIALDNQVAAIWLSFGNDILKWIQFVRDHDNKTGRKTLIFVQLSSEEHIRLAIYDWKVDVIVAQGIEAGGHGYAASPSLFSLVPTALAITPADGPLIVGAGGIATGGQIAALLTLGASGAVIGTRFLMTPESLYTDAQKQVLVSASSSATVRTMAFDEVRDTLGWPSGVDGRGLRNATVDDYERGLGVQQLRSKFQEAVNNNETNRMVVWSGTGVGLIKSIKPAKEVVHELIQECLDHLQSISADLTPNQL